MTNNSVERIIRITNPDMQEGITEVGERQLKELMNLLQINSPLVGRVKKENPSKKQIRYILEKSGFQAGIDWSENLGINMLSSVNDIEEIKNSTNKGQTVIIGVSQKELQETINKLTYNGYKNIGEADRINQKYNIYALSINLENKEGELFESKFH